MASRTRVHRREDFRVAIICALPLEYDAIAFTFDEIWDDDTVGLGKAPGDHNVYTTGRVGGYNVVLLLLPEMGKVSAASAAASLRSSFFGIEIALVTGICGGVPGTATELLLGDVVISKSIVQYDLGRKYSDRFMPKDTIEESLGRPSKEVRSLVRSFQTYLGRSRLQRQASQILEQVQRRAIDDMHQDRYERPATEDRLFELSYTHRHRDSDGCGCSEFGACEEAKAASCEVLKCDLSRLVSRSRLETPETNRDGGNTISAPEFQVFVGRVGSADTVMKSGLDRDQLAKMYDLIALEMEGAGVWDEFPSIIVKSVCGYADSHKDKKWQYFAAATAASTTKALILQLPRTDKPTTPRSWFVVPYNSNPDFVGRSEPLNQIKRLFGRDQHQHDTQARSRVALYGLGGTGKTQIALAYVFWSKDMCPNESVFWVHAGNAERFCQSYFSIAQTCDVPGHDDPKADILALVKAWLERPGSGRWLMVIDNADDTQMFFPEQDKYSSVDAYPGNERRHGLGRYVPECPHGSILITTRNKQAASQLVRGTSLIEVGEMSKGEAQLLFHKILNDKVPMEDFTILSARLEHLPLALAQAAAFIHMNGISISEYVELLDESDDSLVDQLSEQFEAVGRDSETPHAVTAAWFISFNQILRQHDLASDILSIISFLDRQAVPRKLIVDYCKTRNEPGRRTNTADVLKAVGILKAFSLISEARSDKVDIHRLVQLVIRKWLVVNGKFDKFAEHALSTMSGTYPYGEYSSRNECRVLLPHARAVLKHTAGSPSGEQAKASLLHRMTAYFYYSGQWTEAEAAAMESWKSRQRLLGEEHPDTLTSVYSLASAILEQGRWEEAEELLTRATESGLRVFGVERSEMLALTISLAVTYLHQGRKTVAEELLMRVMKTSARVLGEEDPITLICMNSLAVVWIKQRRWKKAEELLEQVKETSLNVLEERHPHTLRTMNNLAIVYMEQKRWRKAEELQTQAKERFQRVLGEEHPDTLSSMATLAWVFRNQGLLKKAEELDVQVMEARKRLLGEQHPDTLTSMDDLANTWKAQGRLEDALRLMKDCERRRRQSLGDDHPDTLSASLIYREWKEELEKSSSAAASTGGKS